jgi:hypothetical protein
MHPPLSESAAHVENLSSDEIQKRIAAHFDGPC